VRGKTFSKSTSRETSNHKKNGKNGSQINTPEAPEVAAWLQASLLGGKSHSQAYTRTQSSTQPSHTQSATFTLKHQGNQCTNVSRSHGSHCCTGNRRWKPVGLFPLAAVPQNWAHLSLCGRSCPRTLTTLRLYSPEKVAEPQNCTPWGPCRKSGPGAPADFRIYSPESAAVPGTALPEAHAGNQNSHCPWALLAWASSWTI
jgi:hypothetical protein